MKKDSILDPMLFDTFIDDLERRVISEVAKSAGDTYLFRLVRSRKDWKDLQRDLNKVREQDRYEKHNVN